MMDFDHLDDLLAEKFPRLARKTVEGIVSVIEEWSDGDDDDLYSIEGPIIVTLDHGSAVVSRIESQPGIEFGLNGAGSIVEIFLGHGWTATRA